MEFKTKLALFLKKNLTSVILSLALFCTIWFTMKINANSKRIDNVKAQIISKHETELDSLHVKHLEFATPHLIH